MLSNTVNFRWRWRDGVSRFGQSVSRDELIACAYAALALAAWFAFAALANMIYPDETGRFLENIQAFWAAASRNFKGMLLIYVTVMLSLMLFNAAGQSLYSMVRNYLSENKYQLARQAAFAAFGFVCFSVFMFSYSMLKTRIPEFVPFRWDETFAGMDRALMFGTDFWRRFIFIYDVPGAIRTMDFLYNIWAGLLIASWILCFAGRAETAQRRYHFIFAIMLVWFLGGNVLAAIFATAGPCYYGGVVTGPDIFAAQNAMLASIPELSAYDYQQLLWKVYEAPGLGLGGISAMPSMHCATSFLFILMFGRSKIMLALTSLFFAIILFSSVMLGWHYLVDGLFAIPIVLACWWLGGKLSARIFAGS